MGVVSDDPKDRQRDYEEKLANYAEAGVAEYWIADPDRAVVTVHQLQEERYAVHGEFGRGQSATSVLLEGFRIDVAELLAVTEDIPA